MFIKLISMGPKNENGRYHAQDVRPIFGKTKKTVIGLMHVEVLKYDNEGFTFEEPFSMKIIRKCLFDKPCRTSNARRLEAEFNEFLDKETA